MRFNHPFYKWWWYFFGGRKKYQRVHGEDWNRATRIYPCWERTFRENARSRSGFW